MADAYDSQKIPSRAENRALKEALSAHSFDLSPNSPPLSPYINRRPLDSRTEAQLHAACAVIVQSSGDDEPEAKLNFESLSQTTGVQNGYRAPAPANGRSQSTSHLPAVVAPTRLHNQSSQPETRLRTLAPESRSVQDLALASAFRRHEQQEAISQEVRRYPPRTDSYARQQPLNAANLPISPMDRPRTAPADSSDVSYATPKTASTDQQFVYASTGFTSAAITPARISTRASNQFILDPDSYQAAISQADTEAAKWMQSKLERRQRQAQEAEAPQPPPSRSSNRGWSFRSEIREYVRPRTGSASRSASRDRGDPSSHSRRPSDSGRSTSAQGWRSWGLQRKSSKSSLVEPPSFKATTEPQPQETSVTQRKELDLNRELPPLPSIDTWQEAEPQPSSGLHIASLMRPKSRIQSRKSVAKLHERASTSEAVPHISTVSAVPVTKLAVTDSTTKTKSRDCPAQPSADSMTSSETIARNPHIVALVRKSSLAASSGINRIVARKSTGAHSKSSSADSCFSPTNSTSPGQDRSLDLQRVTDRLKSIEAFQKSTGSLSYQRRPSDVTTAPPTRPLTRDGKALNFSRKISVDSHGLVEEPQFPNAIEITALPQLPNKKNNFASLRRVLSRFELKGSKPSTWMDKFEANGIKSGVLIHNRESPVAVIRY
jgi:hypothetical protein